MAQQLSGASLPQHSTFAHSKEDVLGALSFYFGQPASPEKLKDFNEHQVATYRALSHPFAPRQCPRRLTLSTLSTLTFGAVSWFSQIFRVSIVVRSVERGAVGVWVVVSVYVCMVARRCLRGLELDDPRRTPQSRTNAVPNHRVAPSQQY